MLPIDLTLELERESQANVRYTGTDPSLIGKTALMDSVGYVQLDGELQNWKFDSVHYDDRCYGWHDLGDEWELKV